MDDKEHFIRQRRNLMITCLAIIFFKMLGLKFEQINILGNVAAIENPKAIPLILLGALVYFLWRFDTACRQVNGVGQFTQLCRQWAYEKCKEHIRKNILMPNKEKYGDNAHIGHIEIHKNYVVFMISGFPNDSGEIKISKRYVIYKFLGALPVTVHTSYFSEYILPYLLTLTALVLWLIEHQLIIVNFISSLSP